MNLRPAPTQPTLYDVAVIGAGVFGAWTAWHLKNAGAAVAMIDQYGIGHDRGSSSGESRVIRLSYGGDSLYSEMAQESLQQWSALSARLSHPILHRTGVLWFSPACDPYAHASLAWLKSGRLANWQGDADALRNAYPQMTFADDEAGFLECDSGALSAARGVWAVVRDTGITVYHHLAHAPAPCQNGLYDIGSGMRARALVYACGPWLPKIFPDLLKDRITPTRQEVLHFGLPSGDTRFTAAELPTWLDFNNGQLVYGMPDIEGHGFKIAFDAHGAPVDPDTQDRCVSPDSITLARTYLAKRFPDIAQAPLLHARVCQYENTSNGDFLIDQHPLHDNVWLVGGGSGHGFKHGPAVGRIVSHLVQNPDASRERRFTLATKMSIQNRTVY
jgi:sarcosine oxidase